MIHYKGKIIVVAGPTASGKSGIAIKLAKELGGYIINGDSRQVYKYLKVGTAKPTPDKVLDNKTCLISGIKHYLYDFIEPDEKFSIFEYQQEVQQVLYREKDIPIIVGGTGLYIDSIIYNYDLKKSKKNDPTLSTKPLTTIKGQTGAYLYFVLDVDKEKLKERIKERIEQMFKEGLVEENRKLLEMGYYYDNKGLNSIGYKEFKEYFEGTKTIEDVKEEIYRNTVSYAKRQRTWFRRNKEAIWSSDYSNILDLASNFINKE